MNSLKRIGNRTISAAAALTLVFTPLGGGSAEQARDLPDLLDYAEYFYSNGMVDLACFFYSAYLAGYDTDDLSISAPGDNGDRGLDSSDQWDLLDYQSFTIGSSGGASN